MGKQQEKLASSMNPPRSRAAGNLPQEIKNIMG